MTKHWRKRQVFVAWSNKDPLLHVRSSTFVSKLAKLCMLLGLRCILIR